MIGCNGKLAAPAVGPFNPSQLRPQTSGIINKKRDLIRTGDIALPAATPDNDPVRPVNAIIRRHRSQFIHRCSVWHDRLRHGIGHRLTGGDAAEDRHHAAAKLRPQIVGIAIGADNQTIGRHRAGRCSHPPHRTVPPDFRCRRAAMHRGAGLDRCLSHAARVTKRINMPTAIVEQGTKITVGPGLDPHRVAVEQFDRHATAGALFVSGLDIADVVTLPRRAHRAGLRRLTGDLMTGDEVKHHVRRIPRHPDHAATEIGAEVFLHRVGIVFQAGVDLAAVATGCAPARFMLLQHDHVCAVLGEMQRRGQSGKSATDHAHRGSFVAIQWRRIGRGPGGIGIKAGRQSGGHAFLLSGR